MNVNSKIKFKLLDGWRIVAEEEFIIKDLIEYFPSYWKKFENDFPVFVNICLDAWVDGKARSGMKYNVGTYDIVDINDFVS